MNKITKHLALWTGLMLLTVPLHFLLSISGAKIIYNHGLVFGSFSDSSIYVRIVFLSVLSGVIAMIATFFYAYLPKELRVLRIGITVLLAGVCGNIAQKIYYGMVWDFIRISFNGRTFYYNLNDLYQWIAIVIIVDQIFMHQDLIWANFTTGKRRKLILYREIQWGITVKVLSLITLASLTQGILAITMFFPKLQGHEDAKAAYLFSLVSLNVILLPLLGFFILKELLRCLRPVYVLEQKFMKQDMEPVNFRKDDHFDHLAENYNQFIYRVKKED